MKTVWNPYLGETRWIQHKNGYDRNSIFALGYENNQSCRNYRILRFYKTNNPDGGFEIYEFSSNSWRVVNAPNCFFRSIRYRGVTLKGNTYWISYDYNNEANYLLSFDFTRERFRHMCLPTFQNPLALSVNYHMALSVVREEELSVLCVNSIGSTALEMWVTNKIETEAEFSWSKSFAVDLRIPRGNSLFTFTSLLIDEEKKVALCCNSNYMNSRNVVYTIGEDDGYYIEIPFKLHYTDRSWSPFIFNYVPSLVHISRAR